MASDGFIAKLIHLEAGYECPIHVAAAILKPDSRGKRRMVSGRGRDAEEAARRCVAEAIERHAAVFEPSHAPAYASLDELATTAIDPRALLLISDRQYESGPEWNSMMEPDHRLPARFDRHAKIGWVVACRAGGAGETVQVPAAHVYLGYPDALAEGFPVPDSSGLAAGESLSAARDRALLELIERDAVSIWWYGRARRPEMRIETSAIPWWDDFARWMARVDRKFWLLDLTHDLGLPVAAAISCDAHGRDLSLGFSAGRSPAEAAASALGELVQFDLTKRLQGETIRHPAHLLDWCSGVAVKDHAFLRPEPEAGHCERKADSDPCAALSLAGLSPLFIELPTNVKGAHVVRAIVPGLRPIWPRFAPGRLFDVAFELGWHSYKLTEADLNPVPIIY